MTPAALLGELRAAGATLRVVGGRLEAKRLPPALAPQVRAQAAELRALLEQPTLAQLGRPEAPGPELPADVDPADPAAPSPSGPLEAPAPVPAPGAALESPADPARLEAPELPAHLADTPEAWAAFLDCAPWAGPGERARILEGLGPGPAGAAPPPAPAPEPPAHLAGAALKPPAGFVLPPSPPAQRVPAPPFRWGSVVPLALEPPRAPHRWPHPLGDGPTAPRPAPPPAPSAPSSPPRPAPLPPRVDREGHLSAIEAASVAQLGPVRGVAPLAPPSPDVSPGAAAAWRQAYQRRLVAGLDVETAERLTNTTHGPRPE